MSDVKLTRVEGPAEVVGGPYAERGQGETVDKAESMADGSTWQTEAKWREYGWSRREKKLLAVAGSSLRAMLRPINMKDDIIRRSQIKTACPSTCVNFAELSIHAVTYGLFTQVSKLMKKRRVLELAR